MLIASIATVMGRAHRAASAGREAAVQGEWTVPPPLTRVGPALLAYASLGGPVDSLRVLERRVDAAILGAVEAPDRDRARDEWLARAGALAFPVWRFPSLDRDPSRYYLIGAQQSAVRGDTIGVRRIFAGIRAARRTIDAADVALDAVYPEAWTLLAVGDTGAAIAWLDAALTSVHAMTPEALSEVAAPGALVRAMALRADLAASRRDPATASRWAGAVAVLWAEADSFHQATVQRMIAMARVIE